METVNVKWGENTYVHYLFNIVIILFFFALGPRQVLQRIEKVLL